MRSAKPGTTATLLEKGMLLVCNCILAFIGIAVLTFNGIILDHRVCALQMPMWVSYLFSTADTCLSVLFVKNFLDSMQEHSAKFGKSNDDTLKQMTTRNFRWSMVAIISTFIVMVLMTVISSGLFDPDDDGPRWPQMLLVMLACFDILVNTICMLFISRVWIPQRIAKKISTSIADSDETNLRRIRRRSSAFVSRMQLSLAGRMFPATNTQRIHSTADTSCVGINATTTTTTATNEDKITVIKSTTTAVSASDVERIAGTTTTTIAKHQTFRQP